MILPAGSKDIPIGRLLCIITPNAEDVAKFKDYVAPGLATNPILFRWLFTIKDQGGKVRFLQTHNQGLRQLLLTVSWDLRA